LVLKTSPINLYECIKTCTLCRGISKGLDLDKQLCNVGKTVNLLVFSKQSQLKVTIHNRQFGTRWGIFPAHI
jgi:hypothetical protein